MPLLTLFALKALRDLEALNSNNVRGGTCLAEAGGAKKSGWERDRATSISHLAGRLGFSPPWAFEARRWAKAHPTWTMSLRVGER